jgi:hypothetical protein
LKDYVTSFITKWKLWKLKAHLNLSKKEISILSWLEEEVVYTLSIKLTQSLKQDRSNFYG